MIKWYLSVKRLLWDMERKSRDALDLYPQSGKDGTKAINGYIDSDCDALRAHSSHGGH